MTDKLPKLALQELREKVEAGELPLLKERAAVFGLPPNERPLWFGGAFHGSLDAAKQMHETVLPGWGWTAESNGDAMVYQATNENGLWRTKVHKIGSIPGNPARAWLIAILKALEEMEDD